MPCAPDDLVKAEGDEDKAQIIQRDVGGLRQGVASSVQVSRPSFFHKK